MKLLDMLALMAQINAGIIHGLPIRFSWKRGGARYILEGTVKKESIQ